MAPRFPLGLAPAVSSSPDAPSPDAGAFRTLAALLATGLLFTGCVGSSQRSAEGSSASESALPSDTAGASSDTLNADLSSEQRAKLGPALQRLVARGSADESGPFRYSTTARADGSRAYGVLVRTSRPGALREAGLSVGSVVGEQVTARLTIDEMKTAARLPEVSAISNSPPDNVPNDRR